MLQLEKKKFRAKKRQLQFGSTLRLVNPCIGAPLSQYYFGTLTALVLPWCTPCLSNTLVHLLPGYQKALERGNSAQRPKGFCEANKVNFFAVLVQYHKCRTLCVIDT